GWAGAVFVPGGGGVAARCPPWVKGGGRRLGAGGAAPPGGGAPPPFFVALLPRREPIGATRYQRHRRAFARQHLGKTHAEPARRAGYERDPAFEIEELRRGHSSVPRTGALRGQRQAPSTSMPARRILHHPPDGTRK